jgi:hypothetical protein
MINFNPAWPPGFTDVWIPVEPGVNHWSVWFCRHDGRTNPLTASSLGRHVRDNTGQVCRSHAMQTVLHVLALEREAMGQTDDRNPDTILA